VPLLCYAVEAPSAIATLRKSSSRVLKKSLLSHIVIS
jgi:hypothetical protein